MCILIPTFVLLASIFIADKMHGMNNPEFIVSVLSLLVTVTIGWQIYSAVDITKKSKALEIENDRIYNYSRGLSYYLQARLFFDDNKNPSCILASMNVAIEECNKSVELLIKSGRCEYVELRGVVWYVISFLDNLPKDVPYVEQMHPIVNMEKMLPILKSYDHPKDCENLYELLRNKCKSKRDEIEKAAPKGSGPGA